MSNIPPVMGPSAPRPPETPKAPSRSFPLVAVIIGGVGCFLLGGMAILAAILFPVFSQARHKATQTQCLSYMKQVALGHLMYAADNNETLPIASKWEDGVMPYVKTEILFTCPEVLAKGEKNGYAMSAKLDSLETIRVIDQNLTVLLFESQTLTRNSAGDPNKDLAAPSRHLGKSNFVFVDGHAKSLAAPPPPDPGVAAPAKKPKGAL